MRLILLFLIWQTGTALCVSFVVPAREMQPAPSAGSVRPSSAAKVIAYLLLAPVLSYFGWLVYRSVEDARGRARDDHRRQQIIREAPPPADSFPRNKPSEQMLILERIGDLVPKEPNTGFVPATPGTTYSPAFPSCIAYNLLYERQGDSPAGHGWVRVNVTQYPNAAWARYKAKYSDYSIELWSTLRTSPEYKISIVPRFGNRIYMYATIQGRFSFSWPSGLAAVQVRDQDAAANEIEDEPLSAISINFPAHSDRDRSSRSSLLHVRKIVFFPLRTRLILMGKKKFRQS